MSSLALAMTSGQCLMTAQWPSRFSTMDTICSLSKPLLAVPTHEDASLPSSWDDHLQGFMGSGTGLERAVSKGERLVQRHPLPSSPEEQRWVYPVLPPVGSQQKWFNFHYAASFHSCRNGFPPWSLSLYFPVLL